MEKLWQIIDDNKVLFETKDGREAMAIFDCQFYRDTHYIFEKFIGEWEGTLKLQYSTPSGFRVHAIVDNEIKQMGFK